eukprot:COSAG06_NODE_22898_length_709_cov_1.467213_1_plen_139_part_00
MRTETVACAARAPENLLVLHAAEMKEHVWSGLSGKMVSEIHKVETKVGALEQSIRDEAQQHHAQMQKLQQESMQQMREEVRQVQDDLRENQEKISAEVAGLLGAQELMNAKLEAILKAVGDRAEPEPEPEPEPEHSTS